MVGGQRASVLLAFREVLVTKLSSDTCSGMSWQKSTASEGAGMCVEVAAHVEGVAIRQSAAPEDGAFLYSKDEFAAFLHGVRLGEFDHLVMPRQRGASSES
jgi:hypothetical protein